MYEEHEDGSFTLHMCEWYEQGRRLVGEYETLGDEPVPAVRAGADADDVPHIVSFSYGRGRMPRPPPPRQGGE